MPLLRPNKEIFGGEYTRPSLVRLGHSMSSAPSRLELPLSFATTATSTSSPDREATRRRRRLPPPAPPNPQEEGITTAEAALTVAMSTGKRLAKRSILGTRVVAPGEDGRFYPAVIQVLSTVLYLSERKHFYFKSFVVLFSLIFMLFFITTGRKDL